MRYATWILLKLSPRIDMLRIHEPTSQSARWSGDEVEMVAGVILHRTPLAKAMNNSLLEPFLPGTLEYSK